MSHPNESVCLSVVLSFFILCEHTKDTLKATCCWLLLYQCKSHTNESHLLRVVVWRALVLAALAGYDLANSSNNNGDEDNNNNQVDGDSISRNKKEKKNVYLRGSQMCECEFILSQ